MNKVNKIIQVSSFRVSDKLSISVLKNDYIRLIISNHYVQLLAFGDATFSKTLTDLINDQIRDYRGNVRKKLLEKGILNCEM